MYVRTYVCMYSLFSACTYVRKLVHVGICFVIGSMLAWRQLHVSANLRTYIRTCVATCARMCICMFVHMHICFNSEVKMKKQGEVMSVITLFGLYFQGQCTGFLCYLYCYTCIL